MKKHVKLFEDWKEYSDEKNKREYYDDLIDRANKKAAEKSKYPKIMDIILNDGVKSLSLDDLEPYLKDDVLEYIDACKEAEKEAWHYFNQFENGEDPEGLWRMGGNGFLEKKGRILDDIYSGDIEEILYQPFIEDFYNEFKKYMPELRDLVENEIEM